MERSTPRASFAPIPLTLPVSTPPVYLVLGATGGIGSALVQRLHGRGARLALAARTADPLHALADGVDGLALPLDATDAAAVQRAVEHTVSAYGRLDGAVCLTGSILLKPAHLTTPDEFDETLRVNLYAAFYLVRAAARAMMKDGGSIVLAASAVARIGLVNHEAIAAAKAGVIGLAQSAAATYANRNVRVNCVAPGLVETPLSARILSTDAGRQQSEAMHALGRVGQPEDVATAIDWLLDAERSAWVTGQTIGVDGGLGTLRAR